MIGMMVCRLCPKCGTIMRLSDGEGEPRIYCPKCGRKGEWKDA